MLRPSQHLEARIRPQLFFCIFHTVTAPPVAPPTNSPAAFGYQPNLELRILAPQPATHFVRGVNLSNNIANEAHLGSPQGLPQSGVPLLHCKGAKHREYPANGFRKHAKVRRHQVRDRRQREGPLAAVIALLLLFRMPQNIIQRCSASLTVHMAFMQHRAVIEPSSSYIQSAAAQIQLIWRKSVCG